MSKTMQVRGVHIPFATLKEFLTSESLHKDIRVNEYEYVNTQPVVVSHESVTDYIASFNEKYYSVADDEDSEAEEEMFSEMKYVLGVLNSRLVFNTIPHDMPFVGRFSDIPEPKDAEGYPYCDGMIVGFPIITLDATEFKVLDDNAPIEHITKKRRVNKKDRFNERDKSVYPWVGLLNHSKIYPESNKDQVTEELCRLGFDSIIDTADIYIYNIPDDCRCCT